MLWWGLQVAEIFQDEIDENKEKEKQRNLARLKELEDIRKIISTDAGLRFFKRLVRDGHIFHTTFTGNSKTYFLEGERNMALKYFADITEAAPEKIIELVIERKENSNE